MKTATVNNKTILINDQLLSDYTIIKTSDTYLLLEKNGVKYHCRLLFEDNKNNILHLKVNGKLIKVSLKKDIELLLEKIGIKDGETQSVRELKAPMPGIVLEIKAQKGDQIKKEDPLIILEAMKMENVLTSPLDGVISSIEVTEKETVEKNTLLIKFK